MTVYCNESGGHVIYTSDRYGFNNPDALWDSPTRDIVAIGDSWVAGACVPTERSIVGVMRETFPEALNLSHGGNGPLRIFATLHEYAAPQRPRNVVWFHYEGNDMRNLGKERNDPLLMRYLEEGFRQGLTDHQADIDRAMIDAVAAAKQNLNAQTDEFRLPSVADLLLLRHVRRRVQDVTGIRMTLHDPFECYDFALLKRVLEQARYQVESWGGNLVLAYLPSPARYHKPLTVPEFERMKQSVFATAAAARVPLIDFATAFEGREDPKRLYYYHHSHLAPEGHRFVADTVVAYLKERTTGPVSP